MRTQNKFALLFNVTVRYADYLFSEKFTCSKKLASEIEHKLGIPKLMLLYPDERRGKSFADLLEPKLKNIEITIITEEGKTK